MKKFIIALSMLALVTTSCVSKKKYAELEARNKQTEDLLNTATVKLNMCLDEKEQLDSQVGEYEKSERLAQREQSAAHQQYG